MRILKYLKNKKGVTLVELIIAIAILGIVIGIATNFLLYGINVFTKGGTQSEIQHDVNQVAFFITNQVKNVKEISLSNQAGYTFLDMQSKYPNIDNISYEIIRNGATYVLEFEITREGHSIESKIILNNVRTATTGSGPDIWYIASSPLPPASSNAQLSNITINPGTLIPAFNPSVTSYTVSLPHGTTVVPTVGATGKDGSTYIITTEASLPGTTRVNVTSADGTKNAAYTVAFTLGAAPPVGPTDDEIIQTVLNNILSLSVTNQNATNPQINVPSSVSGVIFRFTNSSASGGASITIGGSGAHATVGRSNNQTRTGTITLQASLNGKNQTKIFNVTIPSESSLGTVTAN